MTENYIKILLIEDNSTDSEIITSSLDQVTTFFALKSAVHITEGLNFLRQEEFDIVLLSLSLCDRDVFVPFEKVWEQASYIPIIALSDQEDEDIKMKLVKAGVQDFLIKGEIDGNLLTHSILYAIERNKILENLKRENIRLAFNIISKEDSERRLKLALSNVQDIIIEIDNDNICTFMNNSGVNFLGNEILGNELKFFNWYSAIIKEKLQSLAKNEALCFDKWEEDKNGNKRLFRWICNLLTSINGQKEGFLLTAHDITNIDIQDVTKPQNKPKLLGQLFIEKGYISGRQLEAALAQQHKTKILLGEILIRLGYITPDELAEVLIMQAEISEG